MKELTKADKQILVNKMLKSYRNLITDFDKNIHKWPGYGTYGNCIFCNSLDFSCAKCPLKGKFFNAYCSCIGGTYSELVSILIRYFGIGINTKPTPEMVIQAAKDRLEWLKKRLIENGYEVEG